MYRSWSTSAPKIWCLMCRRGNLTENVPWILLLHNKVDTLHLGKSLFFWWTMASKNAQNTPTNLSGFRQDKLCSIFLSFWQEKFGVSSSNKFLPSAFNGSFDSSIRKFSWYYNCRFRSGQAGKLSPTLLGQQNFISLYTAMTRYPE